ncbi:proton-conducting transporter transmembrane domain-containing protein [Salisaeta longa]|uniref:proton-conducting transporter transmembrane domain-containing protein n=1 Tax=Salisaeta longa TaxID=503170 RepID=UPI0003B73A84|nr:proton-conducting transporter membrane subunit [Salisaeta longa]
MDVLLVLPVIVPMITGIIALLLRNHLTAQRVVSVLGTVVLAGVSGTILWRVMTSGIQAVQMGSWPAPFGITLVADPLSAGLVAVVGLVAVGIAVYALGGIDLERQRFGFHTLFHIQLMGVNGAFLTGDLFNMYVWYEVLLIASFVLLVLGNEKRQLDGAVKYVGINLVASAAFLSAIGLMYGMTGTLNLADLAGSMQNIRGSGLEAMMAGLFLVAFGLKTAIFPLYFWLPASYHTPPAAIGAIFAGLLTKVGAYSLIRVFTLLFPDPTGYTQTLLLVLAAATMIVGVLGALVEHEVQRLLAFLVISAMGYVIMGLGFFTTLGLVGAIFYILQDVPVKATVFLVGGLMERETQARSLKEMGGLYWHRPVLALSFIVPAFSLAGFPPFPGFWGKLTLVQAGLASGQYVMVAVALVVGLLTLLAVAQLWSQAFWAPTEADELPVRGTWRERLSMHAPVVVLALVLFVAGLYAQPLYVVAQAAAASLMDPAPYIQAVLGS